MNEFSQVMKVRADTLQSAQNLGYSKPDLVDPNTSIAIMAARDFAKTSASLSGSQAAVFSQHALNLLQYPGDAPNQGVINAIKAIVEIPEPHRDHLIGWIGVLLSHHARYTHTHPKEFTAQEWANQIIEISADLLTSQELSKVEGEKQPQDALMQEALSQLTAIFGTLWS